MPKLKVTDDELNLDELEGAEFSEDEFGTYEGELPPKGTILWGYVKKVWWTYTQNDDPMLKILFVADGSPGELKEYDGLPVWENAALTAGAKFKWAPFLRNFDLTIRDVKTKTVVAPDDENNGAPVEKIATWQVGGDDAYCRIVTGREKYQDEWQVRVAKWLPWTEPDQDGEEPEPEPEPPAKPAARGRRAAAAEPAEEARPAATRGRGGQRQAKPAAAAAKPAARGRGRRAAEASDDEPPF